MNAILPGTDPVFFDGMPADQYHAVKALSKSGVGALIDQCPHAYWWESPFNPDYVREEKTTFDIGTASHLVMLEPDLFLSRTVIIAMDDYKTKAAQEAKATAYAQGKIPLLTKHLNDLQAMRKALLAHPIAKDAFTDGIAERSHFWTDPATGVLCKARPDFQSNDGRYVVDYKTTTSANPRDFRRAMKDHYYFVQEPWYLDGIEATSGKRPAFLFVVQEKEKPYRVSVLRLDPSDALKGELYARRARHVFAECLKENRWPGYTDDKVATVALPGYFQFEFAERDEAGEFETTQIKQKFDKKSHRVAYELSAPEGADI